MKRFFHSLSGVLFGALIFLVFIVITGCGGSMFPIDDNKPSPKVESRWTQLLDGVERSYNFTNTSMTVDNSGNCYVIGYTDVNFDKQVLIGKIDTFLVKYNSSGIKQWTKLLGEYNFETRGYSIAVDSVGNCYITGVSVDCDKKAQIGAFVAKYDTNGNKQWKKIIGECTSVTGNYSIAMDKSDNFYITGYTYSSFDEQLITGMDDLFVIKYDKSGTKQWTRLYGVKNEYVMGESIAVDGAGNYYIAGKSSVADFEKFVIKYNANGTMEWKRGLVGTDSFTEIVSIAVDSMGSCYIMGNTTSAIEGQIKVGETSSFVVKYDISGTRQWAKLFGVGYSKTYAKSIALDKEGSCYITGYTNGNNNLAEEETMGTDSFVIKYDASGSKKWVKAFGQKETIYAISIVITRQGQCYISGNTENSFDGEILNTGYGVFITNNIIYEMN